MTTQAYMRVGFVDGQLQVYESTTPIGEIPEDLWPTCPGTYFYVMVGDNLPRVKIGKSDVCIRQRLLDQAPTLPGRLALVAYIPNEPKQESRWHAWFDEYRYHHEWFWLSDAMVNKILSNVPHNWSLTWERLNKAAA